MALLGYAPGGSGLNVLISISSAMVSSGNWATFFPLWLCYTITLSRHCSPDLLIFASLRRNEMSKVWIPINFVYRAGTKWRRPANWSAIVTPNLVCYFASSEFFLHLAHPLMFFFSSTKPRYLPVAHLKGHRAGLNAVAISPNGTLLASGGKYAHPSFHFYWVIDRRRRHKNMEHTKTTTIIAHRARYWLQRGHNYRKMDNSSYRSLWYSLLWNKYGESIDPAKY